MASTIERVATALLIDYTSVYYIELETGHYECFSTNQGYRKLELHSSGEDFFLDCQRDIGIVVYKDDREMVSEMLQRESLVQHLRRNDSLSIIYRLLIDGKAVYHTMRILRDPSGVEDSMILGVMNVDESVRTEQSNKTYNAIAKALANRYATIYYVNLTSNHYVEYSSSNDYRELRVPQEGNDFFSETRKNILRVIHPDDLDKVLMISDKAFIMSATQQGKKHQLEYRLLMNDGAHHMRLMAVRVNDDNNLVIALENIDEEVKNREALMDISEKNMIFSQIATSLANQYDTIYYVNMLDNHYIEFSSTDIYKSLDVRPSGNNFFTESLTNIDRVIHPKDRDEFHRLLDKPTMIRMLQGKHMITHTYRLLSGEGIMYALLSVIWATDNKHLIVGVMNIDQEIRKEQEIEKKLNIANAKAYRDEMTGVKNKTAFTEYMESLQDKIRHGQIREFSIVVCDVNSLKQINDSLGHIEGDAYIKLACQLICNTWKHSPVFRIGGDEFSVVLQGDDYRDRLALLTRIKEQILVNQKSGQVVFAVGMADFDAAADTEADTVFVRADKQMYADKAALKANA